MKRSKKYLKSESGYLMGSACINYQVFSSNMPMPTAVERAKDMTNIEDLVVVVGHSRHS
ncbi:15703_t:CDS:1, partial [Dentiscutata heterogama]